MLIQPASPRQDHWPLLLLADPDRAMVERYLYDGQLYEGLLPGEKRPLAVAVTLPLDGARLELKNLAVDPAWQGQGLGGQMLEWLCAKAQDRYEKLLVGTSRFGVSFYAGHGFAYSHLAEHFFRDNYPEPLEENGEVLDHMYYLARDLRRNAQEGSPK